MSGPNKDTKQSAVFLNDLKTGLIVLLEAVFGAALSLGSLCLFAYLSSEAENARVAAFDSFVSTLVYSLRTPLLTRAMIFVTDLGSANFIFFAAIAVFFIIMLKKRKREAFLFPAMLLAGTAANNLAKYFVRKPRPGISPLVTETYYGFPSGHAMVSFVFYFLLAYYAYRFTKNRKIFFAAAAAAAFLVLLIGFSRVYLGVHAPSDVMAGFVAGFWIVATAITILKTEDFLKLLKKTSHGSKT